LTGSPVVFVHGMFMTSLCWEDWLPRFEKAGHHATALEWPGRTAAVSELRVRHPDPAVGRLSLTAIVDDHAARVAAMPEPPVLIGHSMGGLVVQLLLNRGLGAAGVAIDSAPPAGVFSPKWSCLKANWPMITPFASAHEPRLIPLDGFRYAFANTLAPDEQAAAYDRYVVPESRIVPRQSLFAAGRIDFRRQHAPLLLVAGGSDHIIPASLNRANYNRYRASGSITDFRAFGGRDHLTIVEPGWEEVADFVLAWLDQVVPAEAADE